LLNCINLHPQGFTFLNIPRSYYGVLTRDLLMKGINDGSNRGSKVSPECASAVIEICVSEGLVLDNYSLDLDVSRHTLNDVLAANIPSSCSEEYDQHKSFILDTIMRSRYVNLYYLLRVRCCSEWCIVSLFCSFSYTDLLLFCQGSSLGGVLRCNSQKPDLS
jgi:hypothetical protein